MVHTMRQTTKSATAGRRKKGFGFLNTVTSVQKPLCVRFGGICNHFHVLVSSNCINYQNGDILLLGMCRPNNSCVRYSHIFHLRFTNLDHFSMVTMIYSGMCFVATNWFLGKQLSYTHTHKFFISDTFYSLDSHVN